MKIKNIEQVNEFLAAVDKCKGEVWLLSSQGDELNLKSRLSQYVAIGALLKDYNEDLELFCQFVEDEHNFYPILKEIE